MAIDYNSGSGVFDKMGPVVKAVNDINTYEIGNFTTDMNGVLGELEDDMDHYYQRQAHSEIFTLFRNMEKTFWSLKEELAGLIEPILAGELVIQDGAKSRGVETLLDHLSYAMVRDGYYVDPNAVTNPSAAYVGTENNDVLAPLAGAGLDSIPGSRSTGGDAEYELSSSWNGVMYAEVIDVSRGEGRERIRFTGEHVRGGKASPDWDNPVLNTVMPILSPEHPGNLLLNGNFSEREGISFSHWRPDSGDVWATDFVVNTAERLRGRQCLEIATNATIFSEEIPSAKLKPRTMYLFGLWAKSDDSSDLYLGYQDVSLSTAAGRVPTGTWAFYFVNIDTDSITSPVRLYLDRQNKTSGSIYVDSAFFVEMPKFFWEGTKLVAAYAGLVRGEENNRPLVGDKYKFTFANTYNGTWVTFFSRYFKKLITTFDRFGGGTGIADALAE